jgi:acetolactate synthase-1/2/3 large subunit
MVDENVATRIVRYLDLEGVDTVFGIPGGALGYVLVSLKDARKRLTYVVCRQETGAAYAADGYHRATGKLGVVMVTSGPGATNALTGTMNAQADGSAVLTLSGEVPEIYFGMGYLQEGIDSRLDVDAVYRAATGYSAVLTSPAQTGTIVGQALRDALTIPRQAVHLSLPNDVAGQAVPANVVFPPSTSSYRAAPGGVSLADARRALELVVAAKRPLILVGNGCRFPLRGPRRALLAALAERYCIPIATTPDGKAVFPEEHPLSLRVYGTGSCEWPYYWFSPSLVDPSSPPYDMLLVLGSRLGGFATNKWDPRLVPEGPVVQVDADASIIARAFPVELGIVGEVGAFIEALDVMSREFPPDPAAVAARRRLVAAIHAKSPFADPRARDSEEVPMHPAALMKCIDQSLPDGAMVFTDAGNCVGWVEHYLVPREGIEVHSALDMGPMGFGVGATMGAKRGAPDRTCVGVVGDGAFMMHGNEVSTAHAHGIGAIWVVLYDDDLHMVTQGQEQFFPDPKDPTVWEHLYRLGNPDIAAFARALGAEAYDVKSPREASDALRRAYEGAAKGRPQVVVARIDPKPVPPYYQKGPGSRQ